MDDSYRTLSPTYSIHKYTDQIYKIVKFKREFLGVSSERDKTQFEHYDSKLDCSLSRTRRLLLEKALCNKWDWFCTFTLDNSKLDRYDLNAWYKSFTQFIRDKRKKYGQIDYLLVPERHEDGAWHCHGFMSGDFPVVAFADLIAAGHKLPKRLLGFFQWKEYNDRFGFCSLGRIKSHVRSCFYISKYITKDNSRLVTEVGSRLFYSSVGLNKSVKQDDIYGHSDYLDDFLSADYEFCKVGMTKVSDNIKWHTFLEYYDIPFESFVPLIEKSSSFEDDMAQINYDQISFEL